MKRIIPLLPLIIFTSSINANEITKTSGGSIKTDLGYGIILNKNSSLEREWITINNPNIPVRLTGGYGIKTDYNKKYYYQTTYKIKSNEDIVAIKVNFLTFDIWGKHIRSLSSTHIKDIEANKETKLEAKWRVYSEGEVSDFYASIAYISQVRTKAGKVIKTDTTSVLEEAQKFSKQFSESDLEPKKE